MRVPILLISLYCVPLVAQHASGPVSIAVSYNPKLGISSRADIEARLHKPFTDGTGHPKEAGNCKQLLAQREPTKDGTKSSNEFQAERSTMADCLVLQVLSDSKPASKSFVHGVRWNASIVNLLPPDLAITVSKDAVRSAHAAAEKGKSWQDYDHSLAAIDKGAYEIVVSGDGFRQQLILWGRGDFNRDGTEHLLVQTFDTLTGGTYRNTRVYILSRRAANERLSVLREVL